MHKLLSLCRNRFRLPHPAVQRLLLWGLRLICLVLLALAFTLADSPTLLPCRVGASLRCCCNALWILLAGGAFLERELSKEDT